MNDQPNRILTQEIRLARRIGTVAAAALAAVLLLTITVASLAQASDPGGTFAPLAPPDEPVIRGAHITETSEFLYYMSPTLYFSDEMADVSQFFTLTGQTQGDVDEDYVECDAAFDIAVAFRDDDLSDGWKCGPYGVVEADSNEDDGVITATLYSGEDDEVYDFRRFFCVEDLVPPESYASSPEFANSLPITVSWVATDTLSGVLETCLWVRFESGEWQGMDLCGPGITGTLSFSETGLADGIYYFDTVATDNVSNTEPAPSGVVMTQTLLDTTPPTVTVETPTTTRQLSWVVEWSAVDSGPGSGKIAGYDVLYQVDSGDWITWYESVEFTSTIFGPTDPVAVRPGHTYSFQVRAYDQAGNLGVSPVVSTYVEYGPLYIPVVMRNYYGPLKNGGFEDGWAGWLHGGQLAQSISTEDTHGGTYAALLGDPSYICDGGVPVGSAWIEQTFSLPGSGVNTLRVWYRIWSEDRVDEADEDKFDRFEIWLNGVQQHQDGNTSDTYGCAPGPQSDGWEYYDIDVSAYAGKNVTLRLENWNSAPGLAPGDYDYFNTWTYVDDIQLLP